MVLLLGWIPVSFCPWYLWGSASGAGQIAEDGTQCTAGHLLRIVSGGGQSADLPRKAAGAVAVSHNAVSDTPSDADAIKAALLESLLLEVSRDVSAFAVYRVRQFTNLTFDTVATGPAPGLRATLASRTRLYPLFLYLLLLPLVCVPPRQDSSPDNSGFRKEVDA